MVGWGEFFQHGPKMATLVLALSQHHRLLASEGTLQLPRAFTLTPSEPVRVEHRLFMLLSHSTPRKARSLGTRRVFSLHKQVSLSAHGDPMTNPET